MKNFAEALLKFGGWTKPNNRNTEPRYFLHKDKQPCGKPYPFCDKHLNIHYHTQTSTRHPHGTVNIRCRLCSKGGIFDLNQWKSDMAKSKKSE